MIDVTTLVSELIEQDSKGNIHDFIAGILQIVQEELVDASRAMELQSSVLTATGVNLDNIGARFQFPRPSFFGDVLEHFGFDDAGTGFDLAPFITGRDVLEPVSDDLYRVLIQARGGQLRTDGTIPSLNSILVSAFGNGSYIDFGDMSVLVRIDGSFQSATIDEIVASGFITKPAGVRIRRIQFHSPNGNFGFQGNGVGFGQAPFVTVADA